MKLSARSYPHPVLGNRDDVPDAAFQAMLEMTTDRQNVYIGIEVTCSCGVLNELLAAGRAIYVLHVECSNTLFRKAYEFRDIKYRIAIPSDNLNDAVEVNVFVQATDLITDYQIPEAHYDYTGVIFEIRHGDILAVGEGQIFNIESEFDALKNIGSIMQISESPENGDIPMKPVFEQEDKIVIFLSKNDFADYKALKYSDSVQGPITTAIVMPVLIEALRILRDESEGEDDPRRWVRALARRMEHMNLNINMDPLILAQQILELPIKRALTSSRRLAEMLS